MMKHPHTLFSTFKRPDDNGRINALNRRQIHIQPNIILPSTINHPNHLKYQNNALNEKMQMMSSKPRVEQKHSSMPPHPQPLPIPSNTYPANSLYNISIPTTNNQSKFYADNKHLFSCIQKQMADCQIPMCLVQDEKGKLHQLVYTLPEKVYKQYVNSLGEKQNVQCQSTKTKEDAEARQNPKKHFKSNDRNDQDSKSSSSITAKLQEATTTNNVSPNVNTYKECNQMNDVKCTKELKCLYKGENICTKESLIERLANINKPARDVINKNTKEKKLQKDNRNTKRKIVTAKCNDKNHKTNVPNTSRNVEKSYGLKKNEKDSTILDTYTNNKLENDSIRITTDNSTSDIGNLQIANEPHELTCDNMSNVSNYADDSGDKVKHADSSLFSDTRKRTFDSRNDSMMEKYFKTMTNVQVDLCDQYPSPTPTDSGSIETTNETDHFEIFSFNGDLPSIGSNSTSSFESSNDSPINSVSLNSVASTDTDYSMSDDNLRLFETTELKDLFQDFNPAHAGYIDNVFENVCNGFESNDYFDLTQDLYADEPLDFRIFEQNSLLTNENCN